MGPACTWLTSRVDEPGRLNETAWRTDTDWERVARELYRLLALEMGPSLSQRVCTQLNGGAQGRHLYGRRMPKRPGSDRQGDP